MFKIAGGCQVINDKRSQSTVTTILGGGRQDKLESAWLPSSQPSDLIGIFDWKFSNKSCNSVNLCWCD